MLILIDFHRLSQISQILSLDSAKKKLFRYSIISKVIKIFTSHTWMANNSCVLACLVNVHISIFFKILVNILAKEIAKCWQIIPFNEGILDHDYVVFSRNQQES